MNPQKNNLISKTIIFTLLTFILTSSAFAYPPDNAAVLYYQACMLIEMDDTMKDMLSDFTSGKIELNDSIKNYVTKNQPIIDTLIDASEIKYCDWGADYSKGYDLVLPQISKFKLLTYLLLSDARILALQGDYTASLNRCLTAFRMAQQINDIITISHLVAIAIEAKANGAITEILSIMPPDLQTLSWFKTEFVNLQSKPLESKPFLEAERQVALIYFTPEKISDIIRACELDKNGKNELVIKRIRNANQQFCEKNKIYWNNHIDRLEAAMYLPYLQAYPTFVTIDQEPSKKEVNDNPDSTMTAILSPAWSKIYSLSIKLQTNNNAIKVGLAIYISYAKTGKLPDILPSDLPLDLFSDKPFLYEKTPDGFLLRCQGKDLNKNETYEYKFKVKK